MLLTIHEYEDLKNRALTLKSTKDNYHLNMVNAQSAFAERATELKGIKEERLLTESSMKILRSIIDTLSKEHIDAIIDMITFALQTIFYDKHYSLRVDLKDTKIGKQANLVLLEKKILPDETEVIIESEIPQGCGGGISCVVGFVLQVFYIIYFKVKRVIILDEALSQVSTKYIPYLMEFIKGLTEKRDFKFLAIFHDTRFIPYADYCFEMVDGNLKEVEIVE